MGACKQCGLCCKALSISYTMAECKEKLAQYREGTSMWLHYKFVIDHLEELTINQAFEANPYLKDEAERREYTQEKLEQFHFYRCKLLGSDNRCGAYESRPEMCSGFPWYGMLGGSKERLFTDQCGFMDETDEMKEVSKDVGESKDDCKKCTEECILAGAKVTQESQEKEDTLVAATQVG